ncbi:LynF/TruF/PatF family peptide O-prenyltransferase [Nostoc sp. CHAB 5784]|uniref:LynF/TruF/PatF family peptide O-prenyltransferase n=1 Tax=Nostoc mirabile TaxID=2907820 RepID=UPI001E47D1E5|nr:LynF/TruF/PatF family peptide O-prenyltransferase [Nostoc mirabile]MCC5669243.1 LynF/TruF/PatF family peptide O-prenyltransferase [Nostoc mirabile CHAB5784]
MKILAKKSPFIAAHEQAFEIENIYALDIFKSFVETVENITDACLLEASCKVELDRIYPARFFLEFNLKTTEQLKIVIDFFNQINTRIGVEVDYSLIDKFFNGDFDFSRLKEFLVGVDLRRELAESSVDLALTIENYPEKQELAIALNGKDLEADVQMLLVNNLLHIGFDCGFNGRSNIELYPYIKKQDWQQVDVQQRLRQVLSPVVLQRLPICQRISVGLSQANSERKIYYYLENINDFLSYFPVNDIARRVHAYYQQQPVKEMAVALLESELQAETIQKINLYYII